MTPHPHSTTYHIVSNGCLFLPKMEFRESPPPCRSEASIDTIKQSQGGRWKCAPTHLNQDCERDPLFPCTGSNAFLTRYMKHNAGSGNCVQVCRSRYCCRGGCCCVVFVILVNFPSLVLVLVLVAVLVCSLFFLLIYLLLFLFSFSFLFLYLYLFLLLFLFL